MKWLRSTWMCEKIIIHVERANFPYKTTHSHFEKYIHNIYVGYIGKNASVFELPKTTNAKDLIMHSSRGEMEELTRM